MSRKRWLATIVGLLAALIFPSAAVWGQSSSTVTARPTAGKTAGEVFKNIQVLNGIPSRELLPTMQYITVALGVRCGFCHVQGNRALDTNPHKVTARRMMRMLFAINKNTFKGRSEVSCYTCHRGSSRPVGIPPLAVAKEVAAPTSVPSPASVLPSAEEVTQRYEAALGGRVAIAALRTIVAKGTLATRRGSMPFEIDRKAPDRVLIGYQAPRGQQRFGFDGTLAWRQTGKRAPRTETRAAAGQMAGWAWQFLTGFNFQRKFSNFRVLREEPVGDQPAYRLRGQLSSGGSELLDFSVKSGLLLRVETRQSTPLGALRQAFEFSDYRSVQGVQMPFRVRQQGQTEQMTASFDRITPNLPLADTAFAPPAVQGASAQRSPG